MEKENSSLFKKSFDHKEIIYITLTPEASWVLSTWLVLMLKTAERVDTV
jgi:hypothetical protein